MGPFETIDLNAPEGVKDYCERYGENITVCCQEQDALGARAMKGMRVANYAKWGILQWASAAKCRFYAKLITQ